MFLARSIISSGRVLRTHGARLLSTQISNDSPASVDELPWFVDPKFEVRAVPPHLPQRPSSEPLAPLPEDAQDSPHLSALYETLSVSPLLETSTLLVCPPPRIPPGPALPESKARGRRKRGATDLGDGVEDMRGVPETGGLWKWMVLAEVKEGAEKRGGIESVIRLVRSTLLKSQPPIALPRNSKRRPADGWAMLDAGNFAVHVLSRSAREKFFENTHRW